MEKIKGVFQVYFVESLIESINKNIAKIGFVLLGLASILLLVVVLLINNTLRLALFSQRFLIRSMQLVGAENWFIQRPFVWNIFKHGLGAGLLASFLLVLALHYARTYFPPVNQVLVPEQVGILLLAIIGFSF